MLNSFRKLKVMVTGDVNDPTKLLAELQGSAVPISTAACRLCPDPCDEGHDSYPRKFDVDMESQMFGSVKPYYRQVVISTGKTDWEKDVTAAGGTLAAFLPEAEKMLSRKRENVQEGETVPAPGIFTSSQENRLAILNGSHETLCEDCTKETVLVFPDYKVVIGIPRSLEGATDFWNNVLDPSLGRVGGEESPFISWALPYSCVILLCSHKRRDNRCAIASPKLAAAFTQSLEQRCWEIHTQLREIPPTRIEEITGTPEEKENQIVDHLKAISSEKKALILSNSHTGGHRYAGNCIIYTPTGSGVWYGRVTPHEVESIVENTIVGGKVLPPLLRGGVNISRPGCRSLFDW